MIYIQPLSEYKFNLKAKKLEGLARLAKLGIPSVPHPFIVLPSLYFEFLKTKKIPESAIRELKKTFESIRRQGDTVTLRNSIFEKGNPALSFAVHNTLNIKNFNKFLKKIAQGFRKVKREAIDPKQVEFCYFLYSFYSSEKCGTLLSNNGQGQIFLQAILGQHTNLLLRGDIEPDVYEINKRTYKIASKQIATKEFRIKKLSSGIKRVRVKKADQEKPVITDAQAKQIAKFSQVLERNFGPQEMEWAILDSGKIIFQETRDFTQSKNLKFLKKAEVIHPAEAEGKVLNLKTLPIKDSISKKIVITNNLNISFINKLAFLHRPKAVILTRGSLTSHAATVLRESKITTVLARDVSFENDERIRIEKDGGIQKIL